MRSPLVTSFALCFGIQAPAAAIEFVPGFEVRTGWDTNIFGTVEDEDAGPSIELGPDLRLRKQQGDVTFDGVYRLRYEDYPTESGADAFEHVADGRARWQIDGRTSVSVNANLARLKSLNRLRGLAGPIDPDLDLGGELDVGRETLLRHRGNLTFTRELSPQLQFQALLDSSVFDFDDDARVDSFSVNSALQLTRALSPRLRAGGGISWLRQHFDESQTQGARKNTFYQSYGIVQYQLTPNTSLSVQAGPSWFVPDDEQDDRSGRQYALRGTTTQGIGIPLSAASCLPPGSPPGALPVVSGACQPAPAIDLVNGGPAITTGLPVRAESLPIVPLPFIGEVEDSDSALNLFGAISLSRQWESAVLRLSYQRRANSASGLGTSTNLDIATGTWDWRIDRRWRLRIATAWQHQESSSDLPQNFQLLADTAGETLYFDDAGRLLSGAAGARWQVNGVGRITNLLQGDFVDNGVDITSYTAQMKLDRRITERSKAFVLANYLRQESEGDFRRPATLDDFRIQVGFNWQFEPIEL